MKTLLLIPSVLKRDISDAVAGDAHPRMDYFALADSLRQRGADVSFLDYGALEESGASVPPLVRLVKRIAGRDAALAVFGAVRSRGADALFTNGENVGIPLALLLRALYPFGRRPGHVTIGHRLSTGKKRFFFRTLGLHREMDTIFVYATTQETHSREHLGIPFGKIKRIAFHADDTFYRPSEEADTESAPTNLVSAAGLEWRDYPTLLSAAARMPQVSFKLAAASPWSKHSDETQDRTLPENVAVRRYEYGELRQLYAQSAVVAVPLYENDFQAGVTTMIEAMAMGKPVIVTQTTGQTDVIKHGENGVVVPPNDPDAWEREIRRLLADGKERRRLGENARAWVNQNATLDRWTETIAAAICSSGSRS
ncbi:MAG: glycosyltransferase family 4 protein [Armatimonadota bacterium]